MVFIFPLLDPVGNYEIITYEEAYHFIITDSGLLQKEAFFFKKPCITLRDSTEWVELVEHGWNTLTGANAQNIINAVNNISTPSEYPSLYGEGKAAENIISVLKGTN